MTVLLFLAVLFVLILVHEWGHFIVAKKNNIRVDEFGIGFPPKLFGVKKGETEYTFNLLPIGGFVRIYGENSESSEFSPVATKGSDGQSEQSETGQGGANVVELQKIVDFERSFIAKPKIVQAAVLVAGVTMNIIFAWFLLVLVFSLGVPTSVDESVASEEAQLIVADVLPGSPAAEAGFTPGTEIVSATRNGQSLSALQPSSFSDFTKESAGEITIVTKLGEEEMVLSVTPETGLIEASPEVAAIGVSLTMVDNVSLPLHKAIYEATLTTGQSLVAITVGLTNLIVDSFTGQADFSQVAGPVGIVGLVGDAAAFGLTSLLMFTAVISLNLAVINMLPFPALDGGRLLFVAIEAVTKKSINPIWVARLNMVGFVLLILLMVIVTYSDITKLI